MSLNYYRTNGPSTWGTSNYRFGVPPEPHFRPQPSWSGLEYYQAHAVNPDPSIYYRIREGRYDAEGVGLHEARHWHRQVYGGFGDVRHLSPREIGHAAAYEAYRIWIHNRYIGDARADFGQRREAFMALAVAEVSHIFPSGQVHNERRKFREACETAAASASTIFHTMDDDAYSSSNHASSPTFLRSGSNSSDEFTDELYAFDDRVMPRGSHRHRRRSSSVSFNSRPMIIPQNVSPYQLGSSVPMPIPINQPTHNHPGGSPYQPGTSPYQPGTSPYQPGTSPYQPGTSPYQPGTSPYQTGTPLYTGATQYPTSSGYPQQYTNGVQGVPMVGSNYDPNQQVYYQNPGSYPQQTYVQAQPGVSQSVPMPPGSTIIIQQPTQSSHHKRHHKHRSSSRDDRRRHRSHSDVYPVY